MDKKEFKLGETRVTVYSNLANMTSEERFQWFEDEWAKGNPILKQIYDAAIACVKE